MSRLKRLVKEALHRLVVSFGAIALTLAFFLLLPLMQQISNKPDADTTVRGQVAVEPPPPEPPEQEQQQEKEEKEPELESQPEPMNLSNLSMALDASSIGTDVGNALQVNIQDQLSGEAGGEDMFQLGNVDQRARAVHKPSPVVTDEVRAQTPGTATAILLVNEQGRVEKARIEQASHPVFKQPTLDAVRGMRFKPAKRDGEPVKARQRITYRDPKLIDHETIRFFTLHRRLYGHDNARRLRGTARRRRSR